MVVNIFGKRGSGKTTTIKGNIHFYRRPVVIVDILGNFDNPEYFHTKSISEAITQIKNYHQSKKPEIIVVQTGEYNLAVDYISAALWEINGGTLVLDEVDAISFSEAPCFDQIIRYGRNHNVDIITGCRRPAELERNISAAANKFYCFGTHDSRDIEFFQATVFGDYAENLQRVEKFNGIFINHDDNTMGQYRIDINGQVFHTQEATVS